MSSNFDITKIYNKYAKDVVEGNIVASKYIILACKRYISWFDRDDLYFDYEDLDRRIRLVSKLKHWKGKYSNKPFTLLPYQQWVFASIFAWKRKDDGLRVTKNVLLFMARKS